MSNDHLKTYRIDPFFASILPVHSAETKAALKALIKKDGLEAPLIVWAEEEILLDGHTRDSIIDELRAEGILINPEVKSMSFCSRKEAAQWVLDHQDGFRQNWNAEIKALTLHRNAELKALLTDQARKRMEHKDSGTKSDDKGKVNDILAASVGMSSEKFRQLGKIVGTRLEDAVLKGEISTHAAYREVQKADRREQEREEIDQNTRTAIAAEPQGEILNQIHLADVLDGLAKIPPQSVSLILSSPPYPLLDVRYPEYAYDGDYPKYLEWMRKILNECKRVLVRGGRLVWQFDNANVPQEIRSHNELVVDLRSDFANLLNELGYSFRGEHIWCKNQGVGTRPKTGSRGLEGRGNAANVRITNDAEYVCVWDDGEHRHVPQNGKPIDEVNDLTALEQFQLSIQVWRISPVSRKQTKHRASFPPELARRVIKTNTFIGDVVLDPFCGIGTTCFVAASLGRQFIGIDNAPQYVRDARANVEKALKDREVSQEQPFVPEEPKVSLKRAKNNEIFKAGNRRKARAQIDVV